MASTIRGRTVFFGALGLGLTAAAVAGAQDRFANVEIEATDLGNGIYMMTGAGGNLGLSIGEDGTFLIDDQFAPLTEKIQAKVAELTDTPVQWVINTHWHGDHVGGNENFGEAGAVVVAHDNVRERMSTDQLNEVFGRTTPASPDGALPVVTFTDEVTFHLNGEEIEVMHFPNAHTDGDSVIHFKGANVIHMGDTFFNKLYPFIDRSSGGDLDGMIAVNEAMYARADEETKIIPGHGPLSTKADMKIYIDMLKTVRSRIAEAKAAGKSLEEIQADKPLQDFEEVWGGQFISQDLMIQFAFNSID